MEKNARQKARLGLIKAMLAGKSWREAFAATETTPLKQAMAYRFVHAVRMRGDAALADGRQGHPSKLRGEGRAFLEEQCSQAPHTPSSTIQAELRVRFELSVSISQINRVRAALGFSNRSASQKKNSSKSQSFTDTVEWQEGAGSLLLRLVLFVADLFHPVSGFAVRISSFVMQCDVKNDMKSRNTCL